MFFNNKFNTFFGLNLTLVYTFPMCMAWRFHFPIRNYDFKDIDSLLPKVHVLSSVCNYSQLFSELWVKTYVDRAVTFYPSGRVKSNTEVGKK